MAGVVGGGGIGFLAINYGYYRYETGVMMVTVVTLILLVQLVQVSGDSVSAHIDHKA
jgi:D-methionine transport system permease protein